MKVHWRNNVTKRMEIQTSKKNNNKRQADTAFVPTAYFCTQMNLSKTNNRWEN